VKELQLNNCEGLNCKVDDEVFPLANRILPWRWWGVLPSQWWLAKCGVRWRFVWWRLMEVCGSDEVEWWGGKA